MCIRDSVQTTRGDIRAKKVAIAVAGHTGHVLKMAGIDRLPIESHVLQAFVSEGLKPFMDTVVTFGAGHRYATQSDKGGMVFGGDIDGYNTYAQRGNLPIVEDVMSEICALFPGLSRVRLLRSWAGLIDVSMDGPPNTTTGPLPGMSLKTGGCYRGIRAPPASAFAFGWSGPRAAPT